MDIFLMTLFFVFVAIVGVTISFLASIWIAIKWCILLSFGFALFSCEVLGFPEFDEEVSLKRVIRGIALGVSGVLLFCFIEQVCEKPFQDWKTYLYFWGGFLVTFSLLMIIKQIRLYYILIPLCCIWVIGYDLSYNVKPIESNIAYVEYVGGKSHVYSVDRLPEEDECFRFDDYIFDAIYEETIIKKSHTLGSCQKGDKYYLAPNPTEESPSWLKIIVGDNIGYIHNDDSIKRVYYQTSEQIAVLQKEQIQSRWYRILPTPVLKMCEFAYEHSGVLCQIDFAE